MLTIDERDEPSCLYATYVKLTHRQINKHKEKAHLILLPQIHLRNIRQEHRMKGLCHLKIVCRAQRMTTKLLKCKLRNVARALRDMKPAAPDFQVAGTRDFLAIASCNTNEDFVDLIPVLRSKWMEVDIRKSTWNTSII